MAIRLFTIGLPRQEINAYGPAIFNLEKGVYNLPVKNHPQADLFKELFHLGVSQIVHDGSKEEIYCLDGYEYAKQSIKGQRIKTPLIIRAQKKSS